MYCHICGAEINEVIVCDIVQVGEKYYYEEVVAPVLFSEEFNMRTGKIFDYEFFKKAIAKKHICEPKDVKSMYIDELAVTPEVLASVGKKEQDLGCRCPICEDFM